MEVFRSDFSFRNDGGVNGYGNYELINHTRPCSAGRKFTDGIDGDPCAPYTYSDGADCKNSDCRPEWQ